jgi:hypothetical protein
LAGNSETNRALGLFRLRLLAPISTRRRIGLIIGHGPLPGPSPERDSAGIEPGQCDGREPPIGLGAEERMVDTKAMEVVVEEGDLLV